VTFVIIRAYDHPLIVEFLVMVLIINKAVAIEVFGLPKRGVSLTCLGLTSVPGS
jgi:hypothetical protein